jgi:DNA-binding NtrC family response regulator
VVKTFSTESMRILASHDWPGNIRELASVVTNAYAMADAQLIHPQDFTQKLMHRGEPEDELHEVMWRRIKDEGKDFWSTVHAAFMERDLNRSQVRQIIRRGLLNSRGSYRDLLDEFRLPAGDYQRFMDFLRHHRLKP